MLAPPAIPPSSPHPCRCPSQSSLQIVVEPNGTIIIGPGNGAVSVGDVRETAEVEYLTGERTSF